VAGREAVRHLPKVDRDDEQLAYEHLRLARADVDLGDLRLKRFGEVLAAH